MQRQRQLRLLFVLLCGVLSGFAGLPTVFSTARTLSTSGQLIQNGGFESQLKGWTSTGVIAVSVNNVGPYDADTHPPHSGTYSAEVGTPNSPGTLSQSVTIPAESSAVFRAWYRLEEDTSLTISLMASDGSIIQQWTLTGPSTSTATPWIAVTYNLGVQYAGQNITVEFDGNAYQSSTTTNYVVCCDINGNSYQMPITTYTDYYPFVDDVSISPTVSEYIANVNVLGLPQSMTAELFVDSTGNGTISEQPTSLTFKVDQTHVLSVDPYIGDNANNDTRFYCQTNSMTVTTDTQVTFQYQTQYYLAASSPYGTVNGTGWYDKGSKVRISTDTSVPMPGALGTLGGRYVFQGWSGNASGTNSSLQLTMDGPVSLAAVWTSDYSSVYTLLFVATGIGAVVFVLLIVKERRGMKKRRRTTAGTELKVDKELEAPKQAGEDRRWGESKKTEVQATQMFTEKDPKEKPE